MSMHSWMKPMNILLKQLKNSQVTIEYNVNRTCSVFSLKERDSHSCANLLLASFDPSLCQLFKISSCQMNEICTQPFINEQWNRDFLKRILIKIHDFVLSLVLVYCQFCANPTSFKKWHAQCTKLTITYEILCGLAHQIDYTLVQ